ncbi:MAG: hypothetical protein GF393_02245 [Armatimonadia bacterium]|nr:hypothetical protein [Armatimonadia bacterium]
MRRTIMLLAVIAVVVAFGLTGCGGGDGGGGNGVVYDATLFGLWQPYMTTVDGGQVAPAEAFDWDQNVVLMTIQFGNTGALTVRHYDDTQTQVDVENGTWTGNNGAGTLNIDGEVINFTYVVNGSVVTLTFTQDGSQVTASFVPVFTSTQRAAELSRAWEVTQVQVDGTVQPIADFFDFLPEAERAVFQMLADGTLNIFFVDAEGDIVEFVQGSWATRAELLLIEPPGVGAILRGVWAANNTSLTVLDEDGSTTKFELSPWAPAGDHDANLVGQWAPQSVTVNSQNVALADFFDYDPQTSYMLMHFFADGTTLNREFDAADDVVWGALGNWNTDNSELTLNIDVTIVMDYTINGNTLTVDFVQEGDDVTIVWTRVAS